MAMARRTRLAAVTGITGFIGGHLAGALARRGWRLRALARSMPSLGQVEGAPVEIVQGHLAEPAALARLVDGADAVIHLAGAIKGRRRSDLLRANAAGTAALAEAWRDHAPVARFLLLSSMAARAPEVSHYAESKSAAEAELRRIGAGIGADADWSILRPAAVYGPGDRETLRIFRAAAAPVQPLLSSREARVTAIHVDDVVGAILALAETGAPGATFELSDGNIEGYSWRDLTETAARALGRTPRPLRVPALVLRALGFAGDVSARAGVTGMLTSQKAREILHPDWSSRAEAQPPASLWQPRVDLDAGFAATVRWYRDRGWLA